MSIWLTSLTIWKSYQKVKDESQNCVKIVDLSMQIPPAKTKVWPCVGAFLYQGVEIKGIGILARTDE